MVRYGASSHKTIFTLYFRDSKSGRASKSLYWLKITAILLNGWILPTGGVHWEGSALQPSQQAFLNSLCWGEALSYE